MEQTNYEMIDLSAEETAELEYDLDKYYDEVYKITEHLHGSVCIGIRQGSELIAGVDACISAFKILYVSTVFVKDAYRGKGIGSRLMKEMESRAKHLGVNTIRLDTFNPDARIFYRKPGYEEAGHYVNEEDRYEEFFFLKRI